MYLKTCSLTVSGVILGTKRIENLPITWKKIKGLVSIETVVCDGKGIVAQNNLIGISSFSPKVVSPSGSSSGLKTIRPMSTVFLILEVVTGRFARG